MFLHAAVSVLNVVESDREDKGVKAVARVVVVGHVPLCPSCAVMSAATALGQRAYSATAERAHQTVRIKSANARGCGLAMFERDPDLEK